MSWDAGARLSPELTLVEPLAEGAMGELWVAEHAGLGARVAVKFLSLKLVSDKAARGRFRREAEAAMQLRSPFVVRLHGHGTSQDGHPFLVFELLEGESLGTLLQREERLDLDETVRLVSQVGAALSEAHSHGIVHRDIKADNVFVIETPSGPVAKVLDFGMAKRTQVRQGSVVTATGVIVGTPEYMSPEQVLGSKQVDHRTDLWALGVLTYRALIGVMPFDSVTPGELVFVICRGQFRRPSELYLPRVLDDWFGRALAPDLEKRFASATEMITALERLAATEGVAEAIENGLCALPTMVKPGASWRDAARAIQAAKRGGGPGTMSSVARRAREAQALAPTLVSTGLDGDTDERVSNQRTVERPADAARQPGDRKVERRTLRYVRPTPAAGGSAYGAEAGREPGAALERVSESPRESATGSAGSGEARSEARRHGGERREEVPFDASREPHRPRQAHPTLRSATAPSPATSVPPGAHSDAGPPRSTAPMPSVPPGGLGPADGAPGARPSGADGAPMPVASAPSSIAPPSFSSPGEGPRARASSDGASWTHPTGAAPPASPSHPSGRSLPPWARSLGDRAGGAGSSSTGGPTVVLGSRDGGHRAAQRKLGYGVALLVGVSIAAVTALTVGAVVLAGVDGAVGESADEPVDPPGTRSATGVRSGEARDSDERDEPHPPVDGSTQGSGGRPEGAASGGTGVAPSASSSGTATADPYAGAPDGFLALDCRPGCAQVVVDGRSLGPSPIVGARLRPGQKELTLKRTGREPQTIEIEIRPGRVTRRLVVAPN